MESGCNNGSNLVEDIQFSIPLHGISLIVSIIKVALNDLSFKSSGGTFKLLFVLSKSSPLVDKGSLSLSKFLSVIGKFLLGDLSHFSDLDHVFVEVDLELDLCFEVLFKEGSEVNLEVFEKADASGKGIGVKGGSNLNKGSNGVGSTKFSKLHEGLSSSVWGDSLKLGNDNLKSVEDEFGLFLSLEEEGVVDLSLLSLVFLKLIEVDKGLLVDDDLLLELASLLGECPDGLGGFGDLVGGMVDSGLVVSLLLFAFSHFDGVGVIGFLLLFSEVVHHVSDEVGNILHWAFRFQLKSNGIEEVFTETGSINLQKSVLKFVVGSEEVGVCHGGSEDHYDEKEFHVGVWRFLVNCLINFYKC